MGVTCVTGVTGVTCVTGVTGVTYVASVTGVTCVASVTIRYSGILESDWTTPKANKLLALAKLPTPDPLLLLGDRPPSPPAPPPTPPPCTKSGRDRFGPGNKGACCEATCTEPRSPSDPSYAEFKLVNMCRAACAPSAPPESSKDGWGCTMGREHVSVLGDLFR